MRDEILTGLQNGISRGESLENARKALAMAGYNQQEIDEASNQINMGTIGKIPEQKNESLTYKPLPTNPNTKIIQKTEDISLNQPTERKKFPKIVIFLIVILAILILGLTFFVLFGETILKALFGK